MSENNKRMVVPADRARCQALVPNGHSFMTLGGRPGRVRCPNRPIVIATERTAGPDDVRGSMSLCLRCLCAFSAQEPEQWASVALEACEP